MKIKRLICTFAAVLGMISCSNEIPEKKEGNVPLSIVLSVGNPETKATGEEIIPSIEEVTINRYHVAIFQGNQRIAHVEYDGNLLKENTDDPYHPKYRAEFENIPEGDIAVYVIANYPLEGSFSNFGNDSDWGYSSYQKQIVSTTSFEADKLVKIGYKEETVGKNTTRIDLSLVQLAAGIDVTVEQLGETNYEEGEPDRFDFLDATESNVYSITDESKIEFYIGKNEIIKTIGDYLDFVDSEFEWVSALTTNSQWNEKGREWFNVNNDKVYKKIDPESGSLYFRAKLKEDGNSDYNDYKSDFKIVALARDVECYVRVPAKGLVKGKTEIKSINGKSNITIYEDGKVENEQYMKIDQSSLNTRFYTYEIGANNPDMELQVEVGNGTIYNIYRKTYRQYGYKIYRGQWIKEGSDAHAEYDWNGGADKGFPKSAWLPVTKNSEIIDEGSKFPERTESGDKPLTDVKTYSLSIPGSQIIKGHLYQVKGTYNPSFDAGLTWKVVDFDSDETIEIPSFE